MKGHDTYLITTRDGHLHLFINGALIASKVNQVFTKAGSPLTLVDRPVLPEEPMLARFALTVALRLTCWVYKEPGDSLLTKWDRFSLEDERLRSFTSYRNGHESSHSGGRVVAGTPPGATGKIPTDLALPEHEEFIRQVVEAVYPKTKEEEEHGKS